MGRTKELAQHGTLNAYERIEAEHFYIFWESNYNPITMWKDEKQEDKEPDTEKVNRYINERDD